MAETLTVEKLLEMVEALDAHEPANVKALRLKLQGIRERGGNPTHLFVHSDHVDVATFAASKVGLTCHASPYASKDDWYIVDCKPFTAGDLSYAR